MDRSSFSYTTILCLVGDSCLDKYHRTKRTSLHRLITNEPAIYFYQETIAQSSNQSLDNKPTRRIRYSQFAYFSMCSMSWEHNHYSDYGKSSSSKPSDISDLLHDVILRGHLVGVGLPACMESIFPLRLDELNTSSTNARSMS